MKDAVSIPYLTAPVLRGLDLVSHLSERDCQPLFEKHISLLLEQYLFSL